MKVDRDPGRPIRHLEWRVRLLGVGAVLALAGMYFDAGWMVNAAIGVLLISFVLRFLPGGDEPVADDD
ncbi:hypothetical protein [Gaopeijia maritima]|uniref:Uncharacterized protein n=1 Tax=Gaopeijia maritima TaxID=3119007 RepID=A0ABU9EAQ8_9BACT